MQTANFADYALTHLPNTVVEAPETKWTKAVAGLRSVDDEHDGEHVVRLVEVFPNKRRNAWRVYKTIEGNAWCLLNMNVKTKGFGWICPPASEAAPQKALERHMVDTQDDFVFIFQILWMEVEGKSVACVRSRTWG